MKRISVKIVCLLLVCIMLFTACDSNDTSKATTATTDSAIKTRDDMTFVLTAEPTSLDPVESVESVTAVALLGIYETLVTEKNGDLSTLEPLLAESWEFSEDGLELTLKIRQGIKFHNGETMTVDDVEFSINRAIESVATSAVTACMDYMEVVDDTHVKLILKYPYLGVLNCLTTACMGIVSEKAVKECEANGTNFARNPIGTNGYKFVNWSSGEKIELERFEDYWRDPAPCAKFTIKIMTDTSTAGVALENGEIDILYSPSRSDKVYFDTIDTLRWDTAPGAGFNFITFNTTLKDSPFSNLLVRQAVAYALNKDAIMQVAIEGLGVPIECPLSPSVTGYDKEFKFYPYDKEYAKELLVEAGYPNGFKCTMQVCQQAIYTKSAEAIQAQLREIGIIVDNEVIERATYIADVMNNMDYDMTTFLINATVPDADFELYRRYSSKTIGNYGNIHGAVNAEIDEILEKARVSIDQEERNELYSKVFQYDKNECLVIPLFTSNMNVVYNADIKNLYAHPINRYYLYYYSWE